MKLTVALSSTNATKNVHMTICHCTIGPSISCWLTKLISKLVIKPARYNYRLFYILSDFEFHFVPETNASNKNTIICYFHNIFYTLTLKHSTMTFLDPLSDSF